jgi:two-component sensor histidine kinase
LTGCSRGCRIYSSVGILLGDLQAKTTNGFEAQAELAVRDEGSETKSQPEPMMVGEGLSDGSLRSLGLEIVETLVLEGLKGAWSLAGEEGTLARITIPIA